MIRLLRCEFKKFKSTYINVLSFLGMLSPILLVTIMFIVKRNDWIASGSYNWDNFTRNLIPFFVILVGPIITSFIAVFSIFYEYQEKTLKNVMISPHGRISIITSKIIYVSAFVLLQYVVVTILNILIALALGFNVNLGNVIKFSSQLLLAGATTIILIPLMMSLTLMFKSFIPAMVITVAGTISNILMLNWDKAYVSPWADPVLICFLPAMNGTKVDMVKPITSTVIYFIIFMIFAMAYFHRADQNV